MGSNMGKANSRRIGQDPGLENDYQEAYKKDPDVKNFQDKLEADIKPFFKDTEESGLSMGSLSSVTSRLAEIDKHLKNLILKNEKDIRKNSKLWELVELYFQLNGVTSDFYTRLLQWLESVKIKLHSIESALLCIKSADPAKCMENLADFKKDSNSFNEEISHLLISVREQHEKILKKLQEKGKKLDRKLKCLRVWRTLSNIILAAAFAMVFIFSVVATAMTAPPLVIGILAAPSLPIGFMGELIDYRLTKYEKKIKVEREVIDTMEKRTDGGLFELNQIRYSVDQLENRIGLILEGVDFVRKDEYKRQVAMDTVMGKLKSSKVQMGKLKNEVEYIREKRQNPKDQINGQKGAIMDIKKKQKSIRKQINAQNDVLEVIKQHQQSFKKQISLLHNQLKICIKEIRNNAVQVYSKKSGIPVVVEFNF